MWYGFGGKETSMSNNSNRIPMTNRVQNRGHQPAIFNPKMLYHVLKGGKSLCGFGSGLSLMQWPNGHTFASKKNPNQANCPGCIAEKNRECGLAGIPEEVHQ